MRIARRIVKQVQRQSCSFLYASNLSNLKMERDTTKKHTFMVKEQISVEFIPYSFIVSLSVSSYGGLKKIEGSNTFAADGTYNGG